MGRLFFGCRKPQLGVDPPVALTCIKLLGSILAPKRGGGGPEVLDSDPRASRQHADVGSSRIVSQGVTCRKKSPESSDSGQDGYLGITHFGMTRLRPTVPSQATASGMLTSFGKFGAWGILA